MPVRDRPKPWHGEIEKRVDDDRIGDCEKPVCANRVDDGRNRDDRIGGVEVPAEQEPRHPGTETAPSQAPFVNVVEIGGSPARCDKAEHAYKGEEEDEDRRRNPVEMIKHRPGSSDGPRRGCRPPTPGSWPAETSRRRGRRTSPAARGCREGPRAQERRE